MKVKVPFKTLDVDVTCWVVEGTGSEDSVFVDMDDFLKHPRFVPLVAEFEFEAVDDVAAQYGVSAKGQVGNHRSVSRLAWWVSNGGKPTREGYWLLFFANMVMKVPLYELVKAENLARDRLKSGEGVYWEGMAGRLIEIADGYGRVPPAVNLKGWYEGQIKAMWRRLEGVMSDADKQACNQAIRNVKRRNAERGVRSTAVSE